MKQRNFAEENQKASTKENIRRSAAERLRIQFLLVVVAIFASEMLVMSLHGSLQPLSGWGRAVFDSSLLVVLVFPLLYFAMFRPLTVQIAERRRAEEMLRQSEASMQAVLSAAADGLLAVSKENRVLLANGRFAELWRIPPELLAGRDDAAVLQHVLDQLVDPPGFLRKVQELYESMEGSFDTLYFKDGRVLERLSHPLLEQGKLAGRVWSFRDITTRKQTEEALRESEERFRSLYENAVLGFYRTSPDGRILMANPSLVRMLGYASLEELNQRSLEREGFEPDYPRDAFKKRLEQEGQITGLEGKWQRRDGSVLFVNENCKVVKDGGGQVLYYEGSVEDITERKQAEEALRESEGRYQTIYDQASDGIVLISTAGELFALNEAFAQMHGYTRVEMMQMQVKDLNTPETNRQLADRLHRFATGESQIFEVQHYHKDGHVISLEISGRRVLVGGKYHIQSICRDITKRKQAEKALRLHGAALEAAANAIIITDRQGIIEWANPAFTQLSGWELTEALGKNPRELVKSDKHDAAFYQQLRETILAGKVWHGEIINRRKDGALRTEDMTITPLCDANGEISHFIAIKQDITEQKMMETQFLLGQRMEAIGALAGGIAHDLNNILSPITMLTGLLKDKLTDSDDLEILAMAHTSAQRGANIIKQLLTYSRGQEGERAPVQLRHLINEMIEMMRETFPRDIAIRRRLPDSLWTVLADPTQLHQVLLNLCVNARDAMPTGGHLTIEAANATLAEGDPKLLPGAKPGDYVVISVSDTGHGIPPDILPRIFDPFFTTKPIGKGTGLGLSTVFNIVKNHGGFVVVDSTPQVGSTFSVGLPATGDDTIAAAVPRQSVSLPSGGQTILVVEDERNIRDGVRRALEGQHFQVITAIDGKDALAQYLLHQEKISLVLTDLMMPMMSGIILARALKAINPALKISVMSGIVEVDDARELVALGIPEMLAKPFTTETLLETVHRGLTGACSHDISRTRGPAA